jgi:hypothetical protein
MMRNIFGHPDWTHVNIKQRGDEPYRLWLNGKYEGEFATLKDAADQVRILENFEGEFLK